MAKAKIPLTSGSKPNPPSTAKPQTRTNPKAQAQAEAEAEPKAEAEAKKAVKDTPGTKAHKTTNATPVPAREQPILSFPDAATFRSWLKQNHQDHPGIWLRLWKKHTGQPCVTYAGALDEALCYGWIDGQKQKGDEQTWLQKFTRRGPRSIWSQVNTRHIARLTAEGRLQPAGQAAVDAARADGRWDQAYASSSTAELPADFLAAVAQNPAAHAFLQTLNKANRYAIFHRLQSAKKPETRQKRLQQFLTMLERGEKLH
ncbi:MAG: hypothetical protein JWL81_3523 [Verrucomicrobiales bacterium]|nr:hypothetical protein [Verrucomicrobiales bacterium]